MSETTAPIQFQSESRLTRQRDNDYALTKLPIYPIQSRRPKVAVFRAYNPGPLDRVPISVEVYCLVNRLIKAIETFHEKY